MQISSFHHVGVRVVDEQRAVEFYARLGFRVVYRDPHDPVIVLKNEHGVELNLVVNAAADFDGKNALMDVPVKLPGYTHIALRVTDMNDALRALGEQRIAISDGPVRLGPGLSVFVRDPDANVIEFRQEPA